MNIFKQAQYRNLWVAKILINLYSIHRAAWLTLGDMSKEDAMKEFIRVLNKCSPSLKPSIIAFKVQLDEEEKKK